MLRKEDFIVNAAWPTFDGSEHKYSSVHIKMLNLLFKSIEDFRRSMDKWSSSSKKGSNNSGASVKSRAKSAVIYVSSEYQDWQVQGLEQVRKMIDEEGGTLPKDYINKLRKTPNVEKMDKNMLKNLLSFISLKASELKDDDSAFSVNLPFDEFELFKTHAYFISKSIGVEHITIKNTRKEDCSELALEKISQIIPSRPLITFHTD